MEKNQENLRKVQSKIDDLKTKGFRRGAPERPSGSGLGRHGHSHSQDKGIHEHKRASRLDSNKNVGKTPDLKPVEEEKPLS